MNINMNTQPSESFLNVLKENRQDVIEYMEENYIEPKNFKTVMTIITKMEAHFNEFLTEEAQFGKLATPFAISRLVKAASNHFMFDWKEGFESRQENAQAMFATHEAMNRKIANYSL